MIIKLTQQQADSLYTYMSDFVVPWTPKSADDKLVYVLMVKVYRKLRNKLEGRFKNGYSLNLTDEEALAYWIFFRSADLTLCPYEQNLIQMHINTLDQKYA